MKKITAILLILAMLPQLCAFAAPIHLGVENVQETVQSSIMQNTDISQAKLNSDEYYYIADGDNFILKGTECFEFNETHSVITGTLGDRFSYGSDDDGTGYIRYKGGKNTSFNWFGLGGTTIDASKIKNVEVRLRANKATTSKFSISVNFSDVGYKQHDVNVTFDEPNTWQTFSYDFAEKHPYQNSTTLTQIPIILSDSQDTELYIDYDYIRFTVEKPFDVHPASVFEFDNDAQKWDFYPGTEQIITQNGDTFERLTLNAGESPTAWPANLKQRILAHNIGKVTIRLKSNVALSNRTFKLYTYVYPENSDTAYNSDVESTAIRKDGFSLNANTWTTFTFDYANVVTSNNYPADAQIGKFGFNALNGAPENLTLDIDYIHFHKKEDVKEIILDSAPSIVSTSQDESTDTDINNYTAPKFKLTFPTAVTLEIAKLYMDENILNADTLKMFDSDGYIYTVEKLPNIQNKTWSVSAIDTEFVGYIVKAPGFSHTFPEILTPHPNASIEFDNNNQKFQWGNASYAIDVTDPDLTYERITHTGSSDYSYLDFTKRIMTHNVGKVTMRVRANADIPNADIEIGGYIYTSTDPSVTNTTYGSGSFETCSVRYNDISLNANEWKTLSFDYGAIVESHKLPVESYIGKLRLYINTNSTAGFVLDIDYLHFNLKDSVDVYNLTAPEIVSTSNDGTTDYDIDDMSCPKFKLTFEQPVSTDVAKLYIDENVADVYTLAQFDANGKVYTVNKLSDIYEKSWNIASIDTEILCAIVTAPSFSHTFPKNYTPGVMATQIRTQGVYGIRAVAYIQTANRPDYAEYGFIVARKIYMPENTELTFELENKTDVGLPLYTHGVAYRVENGNVTIDHIFAVEAETMLFTAVFEGIPESMIDDVLIFRPYAKVGEKYYYGNSTEGSVKSVTQQIFTSDGATTTNSAYDALDNDTKAYVNSILGINN